MPLLTDANQFDVLAANELEGKVKVHHLVGSDPWVLHIASYPLVGQALQKTDENETIAEISTGGGEEGREGGR